MVLSHTRAEHALAGHSTALGEELSTVASDLSQLFAKFDEVAHLQQEDRCVWTGVCGQHVRDLAACVCACVHSACCT